MSHPTTDILYRNRGALLFFLFFLPIWHTPVSPPHTLSKMGTRRWRGIRRERPRGGVRSGSNNNDVVAVGRRSLTRTAAAANRPLPPPPPPPDPSACINLSQLPATTLPSLLRHLLPARALSLSLSPSFPSRALADGGEKLQREKNEGRFPIFPLTFLACEYTYKGAGVFARR